MMCILARLIAEQMQTLPMYRLYFLMLISPMLGGGDADHADHNDCDEAAEDTDHNFAGAADVNREPDNHNDHRYDQDISDCDGGRY